MPRRNYQNMYPSVTSALGVLRKIGLEMWFRYNTFEFTEAKSKKGKICGTEIHDAIEQFILTGKTDFETQYPDEVGTALQSFALFRSERPEITLTLAEQALTSEKYKFNGTIDCIGDNMIIDWKTGEAKSKDKPTIHDEYKYQVAAYVYLWNECNNTNIDKAIIVAIAKDKVSYNVHEMNKEEIDDCFHKVFLHALAIVTYQKWLKNAPNYYRKG